MPLWSHLTVSGDCNLSMMLEVKTKKIKDAYGLIKAIKALYISVESL
jgi:hypothetical protein